MLTIRLRYAFGRIVGNAITSRMEGESVKSITILSIPIPIPPAGGIPTSSASIKSSSIGIASSSPAAFALPAPQICSSGQSGQSILKTHLKLPSRLFWFQIFQLTLDYPCAPWLEAKYLLDNQGYAPAELILAQPFLQRFYPKFYPRYLILQLQYPSFSLSACFFNS